MGKLHELLAVETDLANKARGVLAQINNRFGDVANYIGQQRSYRPLIDGGQPFPNEDKQLPGTVSGDLDSVFGAFVRWVDASIQKEVTNQGTSADIEIDGITVLKGLPAPALLNLESKLAELGKVLKSIPVNDTARKWTWNEQIEAFVSAPQTTFRTEKHLKNHIKYEATDKHPAQVEMYTEDERVGEWTTIIHSGAMQPAQKRELLERWEALSLAVKTARQRANDVDVSTIKVSEAIVTYLRG